VDSLKISSQAGEGTRIEFMVRIEPAGGGN
jgi:hypothetical protein